MSVAEFRTVDRITTSTTSTVDPPRRAHPERSAQGALAAAVAAVPPIAALHLSATGPIEPSGWTISDYVVSVPHGTLLFALTTGALALGAAALARGLRPDPGTRGIRFLLVLWAFGLVVAAAFPTNVRGTPTNLSSDIHLYAGAVVFAALPVAGWLLAGRLRPTRGGRAGRAVFASGVAAPRVAALRTTALLAGLLAAALIANRLPGVVGRPDLMLPPGILQRIAGAAQIVLLATSGIALLRSGRRPIGFVAPR